MRPVKLVISGWGPYKDVCEVDFSKFGEVGLFLITGPTGAGKTTIFDAISFALFGNVSGRMREKTSLRSDFASAEVRTFVSLEFIHKNNNYVIERSPKYSKKKQRGTGETTVSEKAILYIKDEEPITSINDVNNKIVSILGLNYDQYKQISMIAQGEFVELLTSKSQQKAEILRKLFDTSKFDLVAKKLSEKVSKLLESRNSLNSIIESAKSNIIAEEDSMLYKLIHDPNTLTKSIYDELGIYIKEKKKEFSSVKEKFDDYSKQYNEFTKLITEGNTINQQFRRKEELAKKIFELSQKEDVINKIKSIYEKGFVANEIVLLETNVDRIKKSHFDIINKIKQLNEQIETLKPSYEEIILQYDKNKARQLEKTKLYNQIQQLNEQKKLFMELDHYEKEGTILASKLNDILKEKAIKELDIKKNELELSKVNEYQEDHQDADITLVQCQNQFNYISDYVLQMKKCLDKQVERINEEKKLKIYQEEFEEQNKVVLTCKETLEELHHLTRAAAIGIVVEQLRSNQPCPVCGSLSHPNIANETVRPPSEQEIKAAELKVREEDKKLQEIFKNATSKKEYIKNLIQSNQDVIASYHLSDTVDFQEEFYKSLERKEELKKEVELLNEICSKKKHNEQIMKKLQSNTDILEQQLKEIVEQQNEVISDKKVIESKLEDIKIKVKQLGCNYQQLEMKIKKLEETSKEVDLVIEQISSEYQRMKEELDKKQSVLSDCVAREKEFSYDLAVESKKFSFAIESSIFKDEEEYQSSKRDKEELDKLKLEIDNYKLDVETTNSLINEIDIFLRNKEKVDMESLVCNQQLIHEKLDTMQGIKENLLIAINQNTNSYQDIKNNLGKIESIEKEFGILRDLELTAKGSNERRLVFEQYVLSIYFEDILRLANRRLSIMTNTRYELRKVNEVSDGRTTNSLDLEVLDNYTGKTRSVKTLSGGESFKAALSLALGLSDAIQNYAGGVEIDTLFVDEGFGSLDSESLDQAMNTLYGLSESNKLIGIISHVAELKDRIDQQIIVDKSNQGSCIKMLNK